MRRSSTRIGLIAQASYRIRQGRVLLTLRTPAAYLPNLARTQGIMADESKKPRNIKDLKARLGRTIAPNTQQAPAAVPPPVAPGMPGPAVPPPSMGVGPAAPAVKQSVPPPMAGLGGMGIPGADV